jgi:eukaryotic-like serine/threonine-protein kinase
VAVSIYDAQANTSDIWLADVTRNTISRFTSVTGAGSTASSPVWAPDGKRIAFSIRASDSVQRNLYLQSVDGADRPELLTHGTGTMLLPRAWSGDGKFIVYNEINGGKNGIWLLPLEGDRKPVPYLNAIAQRGAPQLSPDSHWISYTSDESGQLQVYLQSVPRKGAPVQVSVAGGSRARWRRDGKELFYIAADRDLRERSWRRA